jgi:hypothetical protein
MTHVRSGPAIEKILFLHDFLIRLSSDASKHACQHTGSSGQANNKQLIVLTNHTYMKKSLIISGLFFGLLLVVACGPSKQEAIDYNDAIIDQQAAVMDKINEMFDSFDHFSTPDSMDRAKTEACAAIASARTDIEKMLPFDGETALRDATVKLMDVYRSVMDNEITQMISIYKLDQALYTIEKKQEFEKLQNQALEKLTIELNKLKDIQLEFAKKYGFEDKLTSQQNASETKS